MTTIALNSIGYLPNRNKRAFVDAPCRDFCVRYPGGRVVFSGVASGPTRDIDTGRDLWTLDFTALEEPGMYVLDVDGIDQTAPFKIANDIYNDPFMLVTGAMYLWRCGIGIDYKQKACHLDDGHSLTGGPRVDATGGWHDAGDYNKYVVNANISVACMLLAWEIYGKRLANIDLRIPESGGPLPDFLAEVKWEVDWLLKMQAVDGSVSHKLSALNFCGFIMPDQEKEPRYFAPWSTAATAGFAASCAMFARSIREYDAAYADRCVDAAVRAYDFLLAHPDNHRADTSAFITKKKQTKNDNNRLWMTAVLWDASGEERYRADFEERASSIPALIEVDWDWSHVANLGTIRYLMSQRPKNVELASKIERAVIDAAESIVDICRASGYARPLTSYYWGANGTIARQAVVLSIANRLVRNGSESKYRCGDYVETGLDALAYLFGRNPYGRSFVTGLGHNPPMHPHDRRSGADGVVDPWPGYLVGGGWPTALDWIDEEKSHETNEIAINWNTALIYALSWFVAPE